MEQRGGADRRQSDNLLHPSTECNRAFPSKKPPSSGIERKGVSTHIKFYRVDYGHNLSAIHPSRPWFLSALAPLVVTANTERVKKAVDFIFREFLNHFVVQEAGSPLL